MGVDENGLGPRLGPLVATSVVLDVPRYKRADLRDRGLGLGLTDSKETGGFGRMAFAESVALALAERHLAGLPSSVDDFLDRVAPQSRQRLRACCPDDRSASQCWGVDPTLPVFGGDAAYGKALLDELVGRSELRIVDAQSRIACAGVLNEQRSLGTNKLAVDLELFEDLIASAHARHGRALLVVCGMIGGIRDYATRFSQFDPHGVEALRSRRGQRRYGVEGLGELRFEVDADAQHLPVALASILGKYVREVSMHRIGEFYRRDLPGLKLASGYHDRVTSRFIEATEQPRRRLGIAPDCFRRQA